MHRPFWEIETELLGITHAEVGAYVLGSWGLPLTLVETVAYHHTPLTSPEIENPVLAAVHVADAIVDKQLYASENAQREGKLDLGFVELAGRTTDLGEVRARARELLAAS